MTKLETENFSDLKIDGALKLPLQNLCKVAEQLGMEVYCNDISTGANVSCIQLTAEGDYTSRTFTADASYIGGATVALELVLAAGWDRWPSAKARQAILDKMTEMLNRPPQKQVIVSDAEVKAKLEKNLEGLRIRAKAINNELHVGWKLKEKGNQAICRYHRLISPQKKTPFLTGNAYDVSHHRDGRDFVFRIPTELEKLEHFIEHDEKLYQESLVKKQGGVEYEG